jgi:hypothetical protein
MNEDLREAHKNDVVVEQKEEVKEKKTSKKK